MHRIHQPEFIDLLRLTLNLEDVTFYSLLMLHALQVKIDHCTMMRLSRSLCQLSRPQAFSVIRLYQAGRVCHGKSNFHDLGELLQFTIPVSYHMNSI